MRPMSQYERQQHQNKQDHKSKRVSHQAFFTGRQTKGIYRCVLLSSLNYSAPATLKVSTASSPERAKIINSQEHMS